MRVELSNPTIFQCSSAVDNDITQGAFTGRVLSTLVANALHKNSSTAKGLLHSIQNNLASSGCFNPLGANHDGFKLF